MAINLKVGHKYVVPRKDRKVVAEYGGTCSIGHVFETKPDSFIEVSFGDEDLIEEYDEPRRTKVWDKPNSHGENEDVLYKVCAAPWNGNSQQKSVQQLYTTPTVFLVGYVQGDIQSEKMIEHARQVLGKDYYVNKASISN